MRLNFKGKIKQTLLESKDPNYVVDKLCTLYNYTGVPHSEGAVLHYMDHTWDFSTMVITAVNGGVMNVCVRYKDMGKYDMELTVHISSVNKENRELFKPLMLTLNVWYHAKDKVAPLKVTCDDVFKPRDGESKEKWIEYLEVVIFGCSVNSLLSSELIDGVYDVLR